LAAVKSFYDQNSMKTCLQTIRVSAKYLAAVYLVSTDDYCFQKLDIAVAKHHFDRLGLNVIEYTIARVDEGTWARKHNCAFQESGFKTNHKIGLTTADLDASNFSILYMCFGDKASFDRIVLEFGFMITDVLRLVILPMSELKIAQDSSWAIGQGQYVYGCANDGVISLSHAYPHYTIPEYSERKIQQEIKTAVKLEISHPKVKLGLLPSKDCTHPLPTYATKLSSGFDLHACLVDNVTLHAGETLLISSGLKVAIPVGYELQIRSRSGLTFKNGVVVANQPARIDADYSGPLGLLMRNQSLVDFVITPGMKLTLGIMAPIVQADFEVLDEARHVAVFIDADRKGGFGSTGV
jgi:dUTP pyrophosphatase